MDHAGDGWLALLSGVTSKARAFVAVCRKSLMERTGPMDSADVAASIEECAKHQKRRLVDQFVQSQLAVNYEYLLKNGKAELPERHFDEVMTQVRSIDLGCDVILAGFVGHMPVLFTVWRDGSVNREETFAVVGTGWSVAQTALFRRNYRGSLPIGEAAYYIYEAKKLSEISSGVGPGTNMCIVKKGIPGYARYKHVDVFAMADLDSQYKRFGIQEFDKRVSPTRIGSGLSFTEDRSDPQSTTAGQ
ncbi:MAG: hypothetical protein WBY44_29355 [Bryobacteraceae bacterium]